MTRDKSLRGGMPALKWLINQDANAALALLRHLRAGGSEPAAERAGLDDDDINDVPDAAVSLDTMGAIRKAGPSEMQTDTLHEILPSVSTLLRALGWIAWPTTGRGEPPGWAMRTDDGRMFLADGRAARPSRPGPDERCTIGGLTFSFSAEANVRRGGLLVSYVDSVGNHRQPDIKHKPRGGKRQYRKSDAVWAYLAARPTRAHPLAACGPERPMSGKGILPDM